jgi:hypothetical protein
MMKNLLGHSTIRLTERYAHYTGEQEAVDRLLNRKSSERVTRRVTAEDLQPAV